MKSEKRSAQTNKTGKIHKAVSNAKTNGSMKASGTKASTNAKKKTGNQSGRLRVAGLDILLATLLLASLIALFVILIPLQVLPMAWIMLAGLIGFILLLLSLILSMVKQPMATHWLRRLVVVVLIGVFGFASYTVRTVDEAISEVIKLPTSMSEHVSVVVLRSSNIIDVTSLKGKAIGVQKSIDTDHMGIANTHLKTIGVNYLNRDYPDYASAVQALYAKEVSAIIMSESYRGLVEENFEDFKEKTAIVDAAVIEVPVIQIVKPIDVTTNSFTVLVSGIDTLGKATIRSNSDANLLVTINPLTKHIVINSIPRDAYLPNACLGYRNDKLTHTGALGIDCTIKTIESALDIDINYYAKITFSSVIDVIDALGGIFVNVPMDFCERPANRSYRNSNIVYVKKGEQTLNGIQALALARHRYTLLEGDLGRAKNQQLVINAMVKKVANPDILGKVDGLIQVVSNTVQTNITKKEIYQFVNAFASDLKPWTISNHVISGTNGWGETASMPGMELSVVLLSDEDVDSIKYVIKTATTDADLSGFGFSTNRIEIKQVEFEGETTGSAGSNKCHLK